MPDELLVAVLAAGASRRLGRPKQLVEVGGEPLIRRACRTAAEAAIGPVAVVLGCHRERIRPTIADLPLEVLINDEWDEGLAASIRVAARAAMDRGACALLLMHADQLAVTAEHLLAVRDAWLESRDCPCLARDGDHLGPPAVWPAGYFSRMLLLKGGNGPRSIVCGDARWTEVSIPSAARDIDLPSDLSAI